MKTSISGWVAVLVAGLVGLAGAVMAQTVPFRAVATVAAGSASLTLDRPVQVTQLRLERIMAAGTNTLQTGTVSVATAARAGAVTSALPNIVTTGTNGGSNGMGRAWFLPTLTNLLLFAGDRVDVARAGTNAGLFIVEGFAPPRAE